MMLLHVARLWNKRDYYFVIDLPHITQATVLVIFIFVILCDGMTVTISSVYSLFPRQR